jgi:hypothetical protein
VPWQEVGLVWRIFSLTLNNTSVGFNFSRPSFQPLLRGAIIPVLKRQCLEQREPPNLFGWLSRDRQRHSQFLHTKANKLTGFLLFIGMMTIGQSYFIAIAWMIACFALFTAIQEGLLIRSK